MWKWIHDHGTKAAAGLLTILTAAEGYDPAVLGTVLGEPGQRWANFALAVAALSGSLLKKPAAAPPPSVPKQQGRINTGLLLWLLVVAGSVGITLSVAQHCRGAVKAAFATVAGGTTPND